MASPHVQVYTKVEEALNVSSALEEICSSVWLSHYEDLVARPVWWLEQLFHFLHLQATAPGRHHAALTRHRASQLRERTSVPDPRTHLHTIVAGGFVSRLTAETQTALLKELLNHPVVLRKSGYF